MSTERRARASGLRLVVTMAAAAACALGAAHLRLANEGDSGPLYQCDRTACVPAQTDDPSRKNRSQMDFYVLPDGCVALARAVLRPPGPGIDVTCGPEGTTITYRCEVGTCRPLDPATGPDDPGAWPIPLPPACGRRIHEIVVLDATTGTPGVFVECDASSGHAGEP